jgi:hypothetical protein
MAHFLVTVTEQFPFYDHRTVEFSTKREAVDFRARYLEFINPQAVITIKEVNHVPDQ